MNTLFLYVFASITEIFGCFAFWLWLRLDRNILWVIPGMILLSGFATLLTRIDTLFAGRNYATYGGIYIIASLVWLWVVERQSPDRWDLLGSVFCLAGAMIILWGPRTSTLVN